MAFAVERGTFTKTTSTSTPVSQQVNLNNGSLTPKFIILWTNGLTTDGTFTENAIWSYGFTDLTNYVCQTMTALDNSTAQNESYSWNNNCLISICTPTGTPAQVSRATVSGTAAGSFTLSWSVQSDTNARVIHYIVGGGDDITNVSAVSTTVGDTDTGSHSYTGSGTSFLPSGVITMTGSPSATSANSLSVGADYAQLNIGAARTATEEYCMSGRTETIGTADTDMDLHNDACLLNLNISDGTEQFLADFTQFDDAAGGGITVNISNAAPAAGMFLGFLFIKLQGQSAFEAGAFQQRSGTGTQDVSFANTGLNPEVVFLSGINSATVNGSVANNYLCLGAADGTRQGCTWCGDQNGAGTMIVTSINLTSQVYRQGASAATASSSTTVCQCTMNDMTTAGMFQLSWGTADTTLRRIGFWAIGTAPAQYNRSPSADTITVSEASLTRINSLSRTVGGAATTADLAWTANPGGENIDHYNVYRSTTDGFVVNPGTTTPRASPSTNSYEDSVDGQTYYYRVAAVDTSGKYGEVSQQRTAGQGASTGDPRYSISFDQASSQYVDATDTSNLKVGETANSEISYSIWLKWASLPDPPDVAMRRGSGCISIYNATWNMTADITYDTLSTDFQNFGASTANVWHHFVVVHSDVSDKTYVYKNNVEIWNLDRNDFLADTGTTGSRLLIGAGSTGGSTQGEYWTGLIDNPRVYNVALTAAEVQTLYNKGNVTRGLVADWRFDEGSGTTANDSSGNNNTATLKPAGSPPTYSTDIPLPSQVVGLTVTQEAGGEEVTVSEASLTASRIKSGVPSVDSTTISESSLVRLLSMIRTPSSDTTTIGETSLTRSIQALRIPSTDTTTISEQSLTGIRIFPRSPSADSTTISDFSLTRMLSALRLPSADDITITDFSLSGTPTRIRAPSSDSTTITDSSLTRLLSLTRAPSADDTTITDSSLTRLLSAIRSTDPDSTSISDSSLTRILSALRLPSQDSTSISEDLDALKTSEGVTYERTPSADTTTISETSLERILSNIRNPSSDTITITEESLTRILSGIRIPSSDTTTVTDSSLIGTPTRIRAPGEDTITISETSLTRLLTSTRTPSADTETVSEASLTRQQSLTRHAGVPAFTVQIPFYIYPFVWIENNEWEQLADFMALYPQILFIVKVNPDSGPGTSQNQDFVDGFDILKAQGNSSHLKILGYVFTDWGDRPIQDVKDDIDAYNTFYPGDIDGILLDEMESITGDESYYAEITAYIHQQGYEISWGNPGTAIAESYVSANVCDVFEICESTDYPTSQTISDRTFNGAYSNTMFAVTVHSASSYNSSLIADFEMKAEYIFVTSDVEPNPYDTISTYLDDLVDQALERVTVSEASLTRSLSLTRALTPESISITDFSLTRTLSLIRAPTSDSSTISDFSLAGIPTRIRAPSSDSSTITDFSLVRLLSLTRIPSSDSTTITDSSLTRLLQLFRVPDQDTTTVGESVSGGKLFERSPSADSSTISDFSLTRLRSVVRTLTPESNSITDVSLNRMLSLVRALTPESNPVTDASLTKVSSLTRSPSTDSTTVEDSSLTRLLTIIRSIPSESVIIDSALDRIAYLFRTIEASFTILDSVVGEIVSGVYHRTVDETIEIASSTVSGIRSVLRTLSTETTEIASIVAGVKLFVKTLAETLTIKS